MIGERPLWEIIDDGVHEPYLRCPICAAFTLVLGAIGVAALTMAVLKLVGF